MVCRLIFDKYLFKDLNIKNENMKLLKIYQYLYNFQEGYMILEVEKKRI